MFDIGEVNCYQLSIKKVSTWYVWKVFSTYGYWFLVVFSACGGIRSGISMPVLAACWLRASWVRVDCLTGLTGSSIQAGSGCTNIIYIANVADCLALIWQHRACAENKIVSSCCLKCRLYQGLFARECRVCINQEVTFLGYKVIEKNLMCAFENWNRIPRWGKIRQNVSYSLGLKVRVKNRLLGKVQK